MRSMRPVQYIDKTAVPNDEDRKSNKALLKFFVFDKLIIVHHTFITLMISKTIQIRNRIIAGCNSIRNDPAVLNEFSSHLREDEYLYSGRSKAQTQLRQHYHRPHCL